MAKKTEEQDVIGVIPNDSSLERQRRREARRKKIIWAFCIFLFVLMMVAVIFVFSKFFFSVRSIEVEAGERYSAEQILQAGGVQEGEILFLVDRKAVSYSIETELPFIVSVTVERDYPGTLRIKIKETKADFCFCISGQYVVISPELKVLDVLESREQMESLYGSLVPVEMPDIRNAVVGEKLTFLDERDTDFIPELLYTLDVCEMRDNIVSIDATSRFDIRLNYEDNFTVKLGNTSDFETKLIFAKEIIASFAQGTQGTVSVEDPEEGYAIVDNPENLIPK